MTEPTGNSPLDKYSHWLEKAYPQASQRQRYFKKLIENQPISHANFRLAHLLSEERLATLVVTPNFDDFLSRALTLFGQPHIVCDHPNTVERIDTESTEIQIVHVHGTYWFYDCCNLRGEIEARTEDSRERAVTMTSLLDTILSRHSPIVIGYAGWEGDVIMTALKRRLQSGLPNNLYWFAFRPDDVEGLRSLLRNHRDACVVVPDKPTKPAPEPKIPSGEKLATTPNELEPTLQAQFVLDKLVAAFTRDSPALTLDPIGFFAEQLRKSFPQESSDKPGEDIYELRDIIRRVERVRATGEEKLTAIEAQIEKVRDAVRRSSYLEALETVRQVNPTTLTLAQREALIESAMSAALGLADNSELELEGYDLVLRLATSEVADRLPVSQTIAMALYNKGVTLGHLKRSGEDIQAYEELLRRFSDATEIDTREHLAMALVNKAIALGRLNRSEEGLGVFDEVVRRFGDATEPKLHEPVARALVSKGVSLGQLNRSEEAVTAYDEVVRRFGDATEPTLREHVATALFNKAVRLGRLNRTEEAVAVYDNVVRRIGEATEPWLRAQAATALVHKGLRLGQLNRSEEEIVVYDEVVHRFGPAAEPTVLEQVAIALYNKGVTLGRLNRSKEEIAVYDEILRRFGGSSDPRFDEPVAKALVRKGLRLGELDRVEEQIAVYDEVASRFGKSSELVLREQVAATLVNKGLTLTQLGRTDEASKVHQDIVRRFTNSPEPSLKAIVEKAIARLKSPTEPPASS